MTEKPSIEAADKPVNYQDFIIYKPEAVRYITSEESNLIRKHSQIIRALRNNNMTVKEIHELFLDTETGKHAYTLKTIYKHLEKLEKADLVKVSGHRMTEGSRQTEKLYSRTGNLFYPDPKKELPEGNVEERKEYTENMNTIISELLEATKANSGDLYDFYMLLREYRYKIYGEILEKAKSSKTIVEILTKTDLDKINKMNETVSILVIFLRHPEVLEKLKELYK